MIHPIAFALLCCIMSTAQSLLPMHGMTGMRNIHSRTPTIRVYSIGEESFFSEMRKQNAQEVLEPSSIPYFIDAFKFFVFVTVLTFMVISWEDIACKYVLPSRHRTSLSAYQTSVSSWGMSTVHGLGFGNEERRLLLKATAQDQSNYDNDYDMMSIPSYNEVMLRHRTETIPQWKLPPTPNSIRSAIHTIVASMKQIETLKSLAGDYQWDEIRLKIHSFPLSDLSKQSAVLRQTSLETSEVIGFDWGSCAWRHCGAIADVQEALDELDHLLGVLEPYEAIFCLDIVERSIRDILSIVPWKFASAADRDVYSILPEYKYIVSSNNEVDVDGTNRIDDAYMKALQELRID